MKVIRNAVISAVGVLALVAGALAQTNSKDMEQKAPIAGSTKLGVTAGENELLAPGWRASKLIHGEVRDNENAKIGTIDDLIISPDGTLSVVIVDVGSYVGLSNHKLGIATTSHKVAIPVQQIKMLGPGQAVVPGATKDELKNLPKFKYAH